MAIENSLYDKKSLRTVTGSKADFSELAKDCVAFANSKGGIMELGIEDDSEIPPEGQKVSDELIVKIEKRIAENTINVGVRASKEISENGAEYVKLQVYPSQASIASTSDGKYYLRVGDSSCPLSPDELTRLFNDKPSFIWETKVTRYRLRESDANKVSAFINDIRKSQRVSEFIKGLSDEEILNHYFLCDDRGFLTNLGILWIGTRFQRGSISYPPVIQVIKYDADGNKISKIMLDDYSMNPKEMLEYLLKNVSDWKETYEVVDGLFRKEIPAYDPIVVRELIVNALVHRPYTTRGDIFINLTPTDMTIKNPGTLPMGVTPENILNKTVQRNEILSKIFYDLQLMEKEGSGYDIMFETLLVSGKPVPVVTEGDDFVSVKVERKYINTEFVSFMDKVTSMYNLSQREKICLGIIVQNEAINTLDLARKLALKDDDVLRSWTAGLIKNNLIEITGKTKGATYSVTPKIFQDIKYQTKTTLKAIEPYRLKELIYQDLKRHVESSIAEIQKRIGSEISDKQIRTQLKKLIEEGSVEKVGERKMTRYKFIK